MIILWGLADPEKMSQNVASDHGLHCLFTVN